MSTTNDVSVGNSQDTPQSGSFAEFQKLVESRRSVRVFTDEKIPNDVMERCLDLALLAPNSSNLQPWDFFWIQDPEKKKRVAEYCFSQNAATTASELIVVVARPDLWRRGQQINIEAFKKNGKADPRILAYYEKLIPSTYVSDPLGVLGTAKMAFAALVGFFRVFYRGPFGESGNRLVANKTTALACQTLMLALRAAGYDTCPMEGFDHHRVRNFLKLPRQASITMIIGAGRASPKGIYGPRIRGPREMFIHKV
jgi:nitroreductase